MKSIAWSIKWAAFALLAAVVAWRAVQLNVADFYAQTGKPEDAEAALRWDARHPAARLTLAAKARDDQKLAEALAQFVAAAGENPAEGRSFAALALLLEHEGRLDEATLAMDVAAKMAPQRTDVQAEVAAFWMRRGEVARALKHLNVVLTQDYQARETIFPDLMRLADRPEHLKALAGVVNEETVWWARFVDYVAINASNLDTLRGVFEIKAGGSIEKASEEGLRAYLNRLEKDGFWTEAYFAWLNSLDKKRVNSVGNVYNGGFEESPSNLGFDWLIDKSEAVLIQTAPTFGASGAKALQVLFRGPRVRFRHVRQHLMLPPGDYLLRGRVRPESLEAPQGMHWVMYCEGSAEPLVASERFVGTDQWRQFATPVTVPTRGCRVQTLQLELAGRVALDFSAKGGVWFDDIGIERQALD